MAIEPRSYPLVLLASTSSFSVFVKINSARYYFDQWTGDLTYRYDGLLVNPQRSMLAVTSSFTVMEAILSKHHTNVLLTSYQREGGNSVSSSR
jgi:hypothetical protein